MQRLQFLAASIAASTVALAREGGAQPSETRTREFYQLRRYSLMSGPQTKLIEGYLSEALIPALTKMGMGPIGAFNLSFGPETPAIYVLIPGASSAALTELDLHLAKDEQFLKGADAFWSAPASAPAFARAEYAMLAAFEGWPKLVTPSFTATKAKRI